MAAMKKRVDSGFTLVEVVIAIAILGFMITVVYTSLNQIIRSTKLIDDRRDGSFIANAVLNRVIREFQMAFDQVPLMDEPGGDTQTEKAPRAYMIGEEKTMPNGKHGDYIRFVALEAGQYLPDGATHSGLVQIEYRVEHNPETKDDSRFVLVREEVPMIRPVEEAYKRKMVFPITTALVSMRLRYFDSEQRSWNTSWGKDVRPTKVPSMIEITLEIISPQGNLETMKTAVAIRTIE